MPRFPQIHLLFILTAAIAASGCESVSNTGRGVTVYLGNVGQVAVAHAQRVPGYLGYDNVSYWDGDGVPGNPRIKIDLSEQKAYFYKSNQLVGVSRVSTGREEYNTPSGQYKVIEKDIDHRSNLYGMHIDRYGNIINDDVDVKKDPTPPGAKYVGAPMNYFMRVTGGVGMHAGYLPGYAASHGCIRLPERMAKAFYDNAKKGTPVEIVH